MYNCRLWLVRKMLYQHIKNTFHNIVFYSTYARNGFTITGSLQPKEGASKTTFSDLADTTLIAMKNLVYV